MGNASHRPRLPIPDKCPTIRMGLAEPTPFPTNAAVNKASTTQNERVRRRESRTTQTRWETQIETESYDGRKVSEHAYDALPPGVAEMAVESTNIQAGRVGRLAETHE